MANTKNSNTSLKSLSFFIFGLMLQSTMSVMYTTSGNIERKFRSVDLNTGAFSAMSSRFADGGFDVQAIEEDYSGNNIFVFYMMWKPKSNMNLCYAERDDELSPGDELYIYDTSLGFDEFTKPLMIPVYATNDSSKVEALDSAGKAASKRMGFVTSLISADSGFSGKYNLITFNKMKMKTWDFVISYSEMKGMLTENQEIKDQMADKGAAFFVTPDKSDKEIHKVLVYEPFITEINNIQKMFPEVFNPTTKAQTDAMGAVSNRLLRYANILTELSEAQPFWSNLDEIKAQLQAVYFLPIINGNANIIVSGLKGNVNRNINIEVEGKEFLNGAAKQAVYDDKNSDQTFSILKPIIDKATELLADLWEQMKTASLRNDDSVKGLHGLYYRIKGAFDGVISKLKYGLVRLSFNQISVMYKAFGEYVALTQAKHTSMNILNENKPYNIKLNDFKVFYWDQIFAKPEYFNYASGAPMLKTDRRIII